MTPGAARRLGWVLWVVALLAALAAGWALWQWVPLAGEALRFAAGLAPLLLWALACLFAGPRARLPRGLAGAVELRRQRRAVLALLRDYRLAGPRSRYALPLYVVLGPAGMGKSMLLERSGLGLSAPVAVGRTQWWVGDEAIFVEATLPGTEMAELAALLRAVRPRLPLNGAVLVLSPGDFALADTLERREVADGIAAGLRVLEEETRLKPPTYLLLAKIDLTPGFLEMFDRMEPQDREQGWGFALADRAKPLLRAEMDAAVTAGIGRLLESVRLREVEWLSREIDPVRCGRIQGFGAQVATLRPLVQPVLWALSPEARRLWDGPALRAIFLTSAQQEALTIDALLPDMAGRFALPREGMLPPDLTLDEEAHGYFIAGAFRRSVFPEAGAMLRAGNRPWTRPWAVAARSIGLAAFACLCIAMGAWAFQDYIRQARYPALVRETAADLGPVLTAPDAPLPAVLEDLVRLQALQAALVPPLDGTPVLPGMAARAPLADEAATARRDALQNRLAPHLAALLAAQLVDTTASVEQLQARLAVAEQASLPDAPPVADWLQAQATALPERYRAALVADGQEALRLAGGLPLDPRYLEAARALLRAKGPPA